MTRHPLLAAGLATLLLSAVACAGADDAEIADGAPEGTSVTLGEKPEVDVAGAADASELKIVDLVVGDGEEATAGDAVQVHYVGVSASDGEQFDASWDRGQPFGFQLGAGMVIEGWDRGVEGMRVGGRRQLTIPSDLAYGDGGVPQAGIAGGETLVFVVDLLEVG